VSVDHLQINISDTLYNNATWLYEVLSGDNNDVLDAISNLNGAFQNVVGLTTEGALIASNDTSGTDNMQWEAQNPVYGNSSYLARSNAVTLRNDVITQLATISNLQSYRDVVVRSYRNSQVSSDSYVFGAGNDDEGLEIFVSNVLYKSSAYVEPADIDTLLTDIKTAFDNITGLEFSGIVISTWHASSDGIFIGVDDATYNSTKYLTFANATTLRNSILTAIATVTNLDETNAEVEIRISKKDNLASS